MYEDSGRAFLKTHYYGGVKKYQWTSIPLAIHGVMVKADGEVVNVWNNVSVPVSYNEADSTTTYEATNYIIGEGKYRTADKKKTAYLLKTMANPTKVAKEEYVTKWSAVDSIDTKILITQDGFLVDTLGTDKKNPIRFLRADFTPLEINDSTGTVDPDSIVTVLPNGKFVDYKGREIK